MKKLSVCAVLAAAAISAPAMAAPGDTATAQGSATAEVVAPITLTHVSTASLDFGTFTTGTGGGTVTVDTAGAGTAGGEVTLIGVSVEAADEFEVAGDADRTFSITTTAGQVTNGTDTMDFTTTAAANGTLDASGAAGFFVGGELTVVGGESAGVYNGTYDVTVAYD